MRSLIGYNYSILSVIISSYTEKHWIDWNGTKGALWNPLVITPTGVWQSWVLCNISNLYEGISIVWVATHAYRTQS